MDNYSDETLVWQVLNGDENAYGFLLDRYKGAVHAIAYHKLGNFQDAEDITQEVFLRAYQKLSTLKEPARFSGWLYCIASNCCKMFLRKRKKERELTIPLENVSHGHFEKDALEYYEKERINGKLHDAMLALAETDRLVLTLYYMGGESCKEIGKFIGASENAVRNRLYHARKHLKKEMINTMEQVVKPNQLEASFTIRLIEKLRHIKPIVPTKPYLPWILSAGTAIIITLLFGVGFISQIASIPPFSLSGTEETIPTELLFLPQEADSPVPPTPVAQTMQAESKGDKSLIFSGLGASAKNSEELDKVSVSGTVYQADGQTPFVGAFVYYERRARNYKLSEPIRIDVNGHYQFDMPPAYGFPVIIYAASPNMETDFFWAGEVVEKDTVLQQDFVLHPASSISGKVLGVENANSMYLRCQTEEYTVSGRCKIQPDGTYRFVLTEWKLESGGIKNVQSLPQKSSLGWNSREDWLNKRIPDLGPFIITARVDGYEPVTIDPPILVARGKNRQNVDIRPTKRTGSVSGRVIDKDGNPVDKIRLHIHESGSGLFGRIETISKADGSFLFDDVPAGAYYHIGVFKMPGKTSDMRFPEWMKPDEHGRIPIQVESGVTVEGIEVIVKPTVRVRGRIFEENGKTLVANTKLKLKWRGTGGSGNTDYVTDEQGGYEFEWEGMQSLTVIMYYVEVTREIKAEPGSLLDGVDFVMKEPEPKKLTRAEKRAQKIARELLEKLSKAINKKDASLVKECLTENAFKKGEKDMYSFFGEAEEASLIVLNIEILEVDKEEFKFKADVISEWKHAETGKLESSRYDAVGKAVKVKGKWKLEME